MHLYFHVLKDVGSLNSSGFWSSKCEREGWRQEIGGLCAYRLSTKKLSIALHHAHFSPHEGSDGLVDDFLGTIRKAASSKLLASPADAIVMDGSQSNLMLHWSGSGEEATA